MRSCLVEACLLQNYLNITAINFPSTANWNNYVTFSLVKIDAFTKVLHRLCDSLAWVITFSLYFCRFPRKKSKWEVEKVQERNGEGVFFYFWLERVVRELKDAEPEGKDGAISKQVKQQEERVKRLSTITQKNTWINLESGLIRNWILNLLLIILTKILLFSATLQVGKLFYTASWNKNNFSSYLSNYWLYWCNLLEYLWYIPQTIIILFNTLFRFYIKLPL